MQYQFSGAVVAAEPQAASLARDVLLQGGTAADAAVTAGLAMTASLPSRVGLMGGGACVVFDGQTQAAEALIFPAKRSDTGGMLPGMVRGMAALHARYGEARWPQLVATAETLARFGGRTSRAFARDAAQARGILSGDPKMAEVFLGADGEPPREGEPLVQPELAAVLSQIRRDGLSFFYRSGFTDNLASSSVQLGQPLTREDIRAYTASYEPALEISFGGQAAFLAPPPVSGGVESAQIALMLSEEEDLTDEEGAGRKHLLAEASQNAFMGRAAWLNSDGTTKAPLDAQLDDDRIEALIAGYDPARHRRPAGGGLLAPGGERPEDPASAGLVVIDYRGQVVACNFTMGKLFGSGRMTPASGLIMAAPESAGAKLNSPVVVANPNTGSFYFAGVAGGGDAAQQNLVRVLLEVFDEEGGLGGAIEAPRVAHNGYPDTLWVERNVPPAERSALEQRGHAVEVVPAIGALSAIYCPERLTQPQLCEVVADKRGFGLGLRAD